MRGDREGEKKSLNQSLFGSAINLSLFHSYLPEAVRKVVPSVDELSLSPDPREVGVIFKLTKGGGEEQVLREHREEIRKAWLDSHPGCMGEPVLRISYLSSGIASESFSPERGFRASHVARQFQRNTPARVNPSLPPATGKSELSKPATYRDIPYDLANFVLGTNNRLAHTLVNMLARESESSSPPTILHGPPGVGKTALLRGLEAAALASKISVAYYTAEGFAEAVGAHRSDLDGFSRELMGKRLLLFDDLQTLAEADRALRTKLMWVDLLDSANNGRSGDGKVLQTLLFGVEGSRESFAKLPFDLRLKERFLGCNWIGIGVYSPEDAVKIAGKQIGLAKKYNKLDYQKVDLAVPEVDLGRKIVECAGTTNPRQLLGLAEKVLWYAKCYNRPVTVDLVRDALKDGSVEPSDVITNTGRPTIDSKLDLDGIVEAVAKTLCLKPEDIRRKSPTGRAHSDIVTGRGIIAYLAGQLDVARGTHQYNGTRLGGTLGGVRYSTISHAITKMKGSPCLVERMRGLASQLGIPLPNAEPLT